MELTAVVGWGLPPVVDFGPAEDDIIPPLARTGNEVTAGTLAKCGKFQPRCKHAHPQMFWGRLLQLLGSFNIASSTGLTMKRFIKDPHQ